MMEMTTVASAVRATVDGRLSVARTLNCEEENYNKSFQQEFLYFKADWFIYNLKFLTVNWFWLIPVNNFLRVIRPVSGFK